MVEEGKGECGERLVDVAVAACFEDKATPRLQGRVNPAEGWDSCFLTAKDPMEGGIGHLRPPACCKDIFVTRRYSHLIKPSIIDISLSLQILTIHHTEFRLFSQSRRSFAWPLRSSSESHRCPAPS